MLRVGELKEILQNMPNDAFVEIGVDYAGGEVIRPSHVVRQYKTNGREFVVISEGIECGDGFNYFYK
jgi:hypothetical protein